MRYSHDDCVVQIAAVQERKVATTRSNNQGQQGGCPMPHEELVGKGHETTRKVGNGVSKSSRESCSKVGTVEKLDQQLKEIYEDTTNVGKRRAESERDVPSSW